MLHDLSFGDLEKQVSMLSGGSFVTVVPATESPYNLKTVTQGSQSCTPSVISVNGRWRESEGLTAFNLQEMPQVLISGEIHGDERVGPPVAVYIAELLVHSARCEIEEDANSCALLTNTYAVSQTERTWLAFLATRRETIIVPTGNCMGYMTNRRDDVGTDPNRDFGYSRRNKDCMHSTTGKLFYQIMSTNLVQIVVTFHGGMVAIGYEWGSPDHNAPQDKSPDDAANVDLANHMRTFAGSFAKEKEYPVGRMNSLVYPVEGGMEDWMYAAGWSKKELVRCNGLAHRHGIRSRRQLRTHSLNSDANVDANVDIATSSFGRRQMSESVSSIDSPQVPQEEVNNRAAVFLVETSDQKRPSDASLGQLHGALDPSNAIGNGHIPRNIRLSLVAIDSVQPYVCFSNVKASVRAADVDTASTEVSNISGKSLSTLTSTSTMTDASSGGGGGRHSHAVYSLDLHWYVGGAYQVDHTWLSIHAAPASSTTTGSGAAHNNRGSGVSPLTESPSRDWPAYLAALGQPFAEIETTIRDHAYLNLTRTFSGPVHSSDSGNGSEGTKGEGSPLSATQFAASVHLAHKQHASQDAASGVTYLAPGEYWLVAWSVVDQHWGKMGQGYPETIGPQTHLANARFNTSWYAETPSLSDSDHRPRRVVRGRKYWPSDPKVLKVSADGRIAITSATLRCAWWRNEARSLAEHFERSSGSIMHHNHATKKHAHDSRSALETPEDPDDSEISSLSPIALPVNAVEGNGTIDSGVLPAEKVHLQLPVDETRSVDSALAPKFTHGARRVDSQGTSLLLVTLYLMLIASAVIFLQVMRRRWTNQKRRIIEIKPRSNALASVTHQQENYPDFHEQIKPLLDAGAKLFSS